jgi:anti-anti-sigma factor
VASQELVRWTQSAGFAVAHLVGELDLATAGPTFAAIAEGRPKGDDLVIDLSDVEFMDSAALGHLVGFGSDEVIRVVAPEGTGPRRVLEITNLTSRFPTFETVDQAVASRN